MKPQLAPSRKDLMEEGYDALLTVQARKEALEIAIAEGICGLKSDATLDEAEALLRQEAERMWRYERCSCVNNYAGWEIEGLGSFQSEDGTQYFFPISKTV